jgi:hypothetical protein
VGVAQDRERRRADAALVAADELLERVRPRGAGGWVVVGVTVVAAGGRDQLGVGAGRRGG